MSGGLCVASSGGADVVIANFRPGQAEELGLDYETLAAANERLIYAENTGFGKRGPLSHKAGMDMVLQAYTGLAPVTADGPCRWSTR